jgi:phospholipid N-methyltransferase
MANRAIKRNFRPKGDRITPSIQQSLRFLQHFLKSPQSVGSVVPSSPALVKALLTEIDWEASHVIAELGGGTGIVTRAINQLRVPASSFLCFEKNPKMRRDLAGQFPDVLLEADAFAIRDSLERHQLMSLDCVVCGLPLVNFPRGKREALLTEVHDLLRPGGVFVAFQYTRRLRPALVTTFDQLESRYIWRNLPPAYVFTCIKSPFRLCHF